MVKILPSNAGGTLWIPGQGTKIQHALGPKNQNIKQKQYCNKSNKDFKKGSTSKNLKKKKKKGNVKSRHSCMTSREIR